MGEGPRRAAYLTELAILIMRSISAERPAPLGPDSGYHRRMAGFLSCCLQGLEQTRSFNLGAANLTLAAIALAGIGTLASGAVAVWQHIR